MWDSQLEVCRFCEGELSHHSATLDVHIQQSNGKIVSGECATKRSSGYERSVKRESNRMCTKENILPHQRLNLMPLTHVSRFWQGKQKTELVTECYKNHLCGSFHRWTGWLVGGDERGRSQVRSGRGSTLCETRGGLRETPTRGSGTLCAIVRHECSLRLHAASPTLPLPPRNIAAKTSTQSPCLSSAPRCTRSKVNLAYSVMSS